MVTIRVAQASPTETEVTFSVVYGVQYGPFGWVVTTLMMKRMLGKAFDTALAGLSSHLTVCRSRRRRRGRQRPRQPAEI